MSGYSFSHQFPQNWMQAPDQVRGSIVQELKDIMTLLRTETAVSEFAFTHPDLDSYLDDIYAKDYAQKLELAEAQKAEQEKERLRHEILEKQRLNRERLEKERVEKTRVEQEQQRKALEENQQKEKLQAIREAQQHKDAQADAEQQQRDYERKQAKEQALQKNTEAEQENNSAVASVPTGSDTTNTADNNVDKFDPSSNVNSAKDNQAPSGGLIELNKDQQAFVHELEMRIDDYLSEQMAKMSEDLKSWLHDEVQRQLARSNSR